MWPTESPGETSILIIMWLQIKPCFLAAPVTALTYVGNATLLKTLLTLFPYGSSGNHDFKVDIGSVPELYPLSSIFLIHSSKRYRLGQPFSTGPVWNKAGSLCFDCLLQDDTESSAVFQIAGRQSMPSRCTFPNTDRPGPACHAGLLFSHCRLTSNASN